MALVDWLGTLKRKPWGIVALLATYAGTIASFFVDWRLALGVASVGFVGTFVAHVGNLSKELQDETRTLEHEEIGARTLAIVQDLDERVQTPAMQAQEYLLGEIIRTAAISAERLEQLLAESDVFLVYVYAAGIPSVDKTLKHTRFYPDDLAKAFGLVRLGKRAGLFAGSWSNVERDLRSVDTFTAAVTSLVRRSLQREWVHLEKITRRFKVHDEFVNKEWNEAVRASVMVAPVDRGALRIATVEESTLPVQFYSLVGGSLRRRKALQRVVTRVDLEKVVKRITLSSLVPRIPASYRAKLDSLEAEILEGLGCRTVFDLALKQPGELHHFLRRVWPRAYEDKASEIVARSAGFREALVAAGLDLRRL